ncbi:hypothetical protein [Leptospira wolffii]|uniref:hypothetical protein n=1 Tax=Leptospira wolffii TaxID=409998 RepID=UPI00058DEBC4|nr:hypothetical protein [Leptospira wolffii]
MIVKVIGQGENGKVLVETEYGRMTTNWEGTLPTFGMECPVEISLDNVSITNVSEFGAKGGNTQYKFEGGIQKWIDSGHIKELKP